MISTRYDFLLYHALGNVYESEDDFNSLTALGWIDAQLSQDVKPLTPSNWVPVPRMETGRISQPFMADGSESDGVPFAGNENKWHGARDVADGA